jgi:hypothetical protein
LDNFWTIWWTILRIISRTILGMIWWKLYEQFFRGITIYSVETAMHSAAACIYSEFSKFGLHAYFWKIQVILRCRNPFLAFFSDCAVDFKGPTSDTFSYVFRIPSTEKNAKNGFLHHKITWIFQKDTWSQKKNFCHRCMRLHCAL